MLAGGSPADQRVALRTLQQIAEIKFDRAAFAGSIRALLTSPDDEVRGAALQALPAYPMSQDDLAPVAAMAADRSPRVRAGVANALVVANGRVGSAELDAAMLTLLDDVDLNVRRESMRATANIDLSEAVENKLIALSFDPKLSRDAITQGISTRPVVDGAIARRLIDLLDDADPQNVSRAAWALRNATLEGTDRAELDAALLRTLDDSLNVGVRESCVNALARSPDPAIYERLGEIARDPQESDRVRDAAIRSQR
jgi:HEAT repeat protein